MRTTEGLLDIRSDRVGVVNETNSERNLSLAQGAGNVQENNNGSSAWCESEEAEQGHESEEALMRLPPILSTPEVITERSLWLLRLDRPSCPLARQCSGYRAAETLLLQSGVRGRQLAPAATSERLTTYRPCPNYVSMKTSESLIALL
jgi:hypothetical protein